MCQISGSATTEATTAATREAATAASTAASAATATGAFVVATATATPSAAAAAAEEVHAVADVEHGIGGDGVDFAVGPAVGVDGTGEVGLLVENVVPLKHDGEYLATEEAVAELCVPDELVGVECLVGITTLAVAMEVGREHWP